MAWLEERFGGSWIFAGLFERNNRSCACPARRSYPVVKRVKQGDITWFGAYKQA